MRLFHENSMLNMWLLLLFLLNQHLYASVYCGKIDPANLGLWILYCMSSYVPSSTCGVHLERETEISSVDNGSKRRESKTKVDPPILEFSEIISFFQIFNIHLFQKFLSENKALHLLMVYKNECLIQSCNIRSKVRISFLSHLKRIF